jgi:hypothetical protein
LELFLSYAFPGRSADDAGAGSMLPLPSVVVDEDDEEDDDDVRTLVSVLLVS